MNAFLNGLVRAIAEGFDLPEPVVEIGSYQVQGQEEIAELRSLFPGKKYIGLDMRPGLGVDLAGDVERLPLADASVGSIIAVNTFEHVPRFWRGFDEMYRVLRPDGMLLVSCPFYFYIHNYPGDYWRFTPQALELLLEKYPRRILGWHGAAKRPQSVWALAFREDAAQMTDGQFQKYKQGLERYAREPLRAGRVMRYRLAQILCGRGPFAPYLDQGKWETEYRTSAAR